MADTERAVHLPSEEPENTQQEASSCCACGTVLESGEDIADTHKSKIRTEEEQKKLLNRLKRIEGQIRGIESMIENGRYCTDILVQSSAVSSAMNAFNRELLANHIRTCVAENIRQGHDEVIDELVLLTQKLMK